MLSMAEKWKPIPGYEDRYAISSSGRVKSLPFLQRYRLRTGEFAMRRTRERYLAQHLQNSGYLVVWLWRDNRQEAKTVHRLVAEAFLPRPAKRTVNHIDGCKTHNHVRNLEWATHREQHAHALALGLRLQAIPVRHPQTGEVFPSIMAAARKCRLGHRTVRRLFDRVSDV